MRSLNALPAWALLAPAAAWLLLGGLLLGPGAWYQALLVPALVASVLAGVHHAEVVAHRVGEPYGTLVLALAITVIETGLIVSLMIAGGPSTAALARDATFASVMIILNGMVGLCVLLGAQRHHEQVFGLQGVGAALATLAAITVLCFVLPNYTTSTPGPVFSQGQLLFVAVVCVVLYGVFVLVQTVRHRDYFLPPTGAENEDLHASPPSRATAQVSGALMLASLSAVVLLGKALSPSIEALVQRLGAPQALIGVIIAMVVLLPESLAALRAARVNRLQTSMNLALGSALACLGLTIPAVALVSMAMGWQLVLGIDAKSTVLLMLSLMVATLTLATGRTTVLHGSVHLVLFCTYLFVTVVP